MDNQHQEKVPRWARRIDHYGREKWHKDRPGSHRKGEYIGNVIFGFIFLWIVNKVPEWNLGFIRDNYEVILWILNLNIMVQIAGNALMFIVELAPVRYFSRMVMEAASFLLNIVLYYIYPFDFSHFHGLFWLDMLIPILLIIGMVVSALKVFSNLWKLIFWR
jgi:hypothetical protein